MSDHVDKAKEVVHAVEHPVETAKALEQEAEEGISPRTPLIAITGITLFLGVIFVILLAIALTLYFVYGGEEPAHPPAYTDPLPESQVFARSHPKGWAGTT